MYTHAHIADIALAREGLNDELALIGHEYVNDIAIAERWLSASYAYADAHNESFARRWAYAVRARGMRIKAAEHAAASASHALRTYVSDAHFVAH